MSKETICRNCKHCRPAPWFVYIFKMFFPDEPIGVWIQAECKLKDYSYVDYVSGKTITEVTLCSKINKYGNCEYYEDK